MPEGCKRNNKLMRIPGIVVVTLLWSAFMQKIAKSVIQAAKQRITSPIFTNHLRATTLQSRVYVAPQRRFLSLGKMASSKFEDIPIDDLRSATLGALVAQGYSITEAGIITDTLMYAELRANNQGLIKLVAGALKPEPGESEIRCTYETPVSAMIDGGRRCGMVILDYAVRTALEKAKVTGICIAGCSNYASATGALGAWARKITDEGYIGIVMSQCNEMVAPHGCYEPIFGTNPIAFGLPTKPRAQIFDMATSAIAYFGLKTAEAEGKNIPSDVAYDDQGRSTTDPAAALRGAIRVFDRGFKGSHLALMVELLAGAWTGAAMENKLESGNWGSLIMVINPNILGPVEEFQERAEVMCQRVKHAKQVPDSDADVPEPKKKETFLPGERGDLLEAENLRNGTLRVSSSLYKQMQEMAAKAPRSGL